MADPIPEQKAAWLDGYKAAAECAASFRVRVGQQDVDDALNHGARMVASILKSQVDKMEPK